MSPSFSQKAEKAGEDTAKLAKEKTKRVRSRLETDEDFRRKFIIAGVSALGAVAVAIGGYFAFKRRDDIKKSLKGARDTIKDKIDHHSATKPASTAP